MERWVWLILVITLTAGPLVLDKFLQGLLIQVFILAVFAMSYDLLMGYSGILSFGHAMFFGIGAYTVGILLKKAAWPLPGAILVAVLVAIAFSALTGLLTLRVRGVYLAMATLAFAEVVFILAGSQELRALTGGDEGMHGIPVPDWMSPTAQRVVFYYIALTFLVAMYLLARRLVNSPLGRVLIAIRENENRAEAIGYNVFIFKLLIIVIAGVLAALAGALNVLYFRSATPEVLGVGRTIDALLMTIIGGVGTLIGPIFGAVVIRFLGNYLADWFGQRWQLVFGVVYILLVMFFPYGIVGTWEVQSQRLRTWWRMSRARTHNTGI
jgi:branched-chain amino acid transport system permease protein